MRMFELHFPELPYYLKAYLTVGEDNQKVEIHSRFHVEKVVIMPHTWSLDFPMNRLRGDVFSFIVKRYGLTKDPVSYS